MAVNKPLAVETDNVLKNAPVNNTQKMYLSSSIENFKIEIGPKVIQSCSILRNVSTFTADNDPIEVDMTKKQLKQFVRLHEHFTEDDPWDKEDPYWIGKFFYKMSDEEFKQLCCKADYLDSQRFLFHAANYLLIKLEAMEVEDIQKYLNIVDDYTEDERKAMENEPLKFFINVAANKENQSFKLHRSQDRAHWISPHYPPRLYPLQELPEATDFLFHQQNFSFPSSFINFAFTTLKIPEDFFLKIYSTCKYFFSKLKVIPCDTVNAGVWQTENIRIYYGRETIDLPPEAITNINANFYPFHRFGIDDEFHAPENCYILLKKIVANKISKAHIFNKKLVLTIEEFKLLFYRVTSVSLCMKIVDSNGSIVPMEEILSYLPNVDCFEYRPVAPECYTSKSAKKIAELKRSVKYKSFTLYYPPPEEFNADHFAQFVKNHFHPTYMGNIEIIFNNDVGGDIIAVFYSVVLEAIDSREYPSKKPRLVCRNHAGISFNSKPY